MEAILSYCSYFFNDNQTIMVSLILAGFLGSLSHCSIMCSPLVAAQILQLNETKISQWRMVFYHAGRLTTYAMLGALSVWVGSWVFSGGLSNFANIMLIAAGITFIISAVLPRKTHHCCSKKTQKINNYIDHHYLPQIALYLRGILMGFMPCGMVVAVLLLVATLTNPLVAALAMVIFGLTTIPVLQIAGMGALSLAKRYPNATAKTGRGVMALNGLWLCAIGFGIVSMN